MTSSQVIPVGIVGAGPAGVAAAVQLKRQGIPFIIFEKYRIGGLLREAHLIENHLGFPSGLSGLKAAALLQKHLEQWDIPVILSEAHSVVWEGEVWRVVANTTVYLFRYLVLATGTVPRKFNLPAKDGEAYLRIFTGIETLREWQGKTIAIIGGGDAAFDYALNLSWHNRVAIHHRHNRFHCLNLLRDRAANSPNISLKTFSNINSIQSEGDRLFLEWSEPEGTSVETADALLCAVGRDGDLTCLGAAARENLEEHISSDRLHLVGDLRNGALRQMSIAAGDGLSAAMRIEGMLRDVKV